MNNLILDCSCGMSIYLKTENDVFSKIDADVKKHTDELLYEIDVLLKNAGIEVSKIDNICVCVGPGSFTGIRVAISIAKGLAIGTGAKVFSLSNFDVIDRQESEDAYYVLEGFSKFIYVREIIKNKISDYCIEIDKFAENYRNKNNQINIYALNKKTQNQFYAFEINAKIVNINPIIYFDREIKNGKYIDLNKIMPMYLRASQAEIERGKLDAKA